MQKFNNTKLSYEELSKLQFLRANYQKYDLFSIQEVDEKEYRDWQQTQINLGAQFFEMMKSYGFFEGNEEIFEVGCGYHESVVNSAALSNYDTDRARIITPYSKLKKTQFSDDLKSKIIPCDNNLIYTCGDYGNCLNPYSFYRSKPHYYNLDSTFVVANPLVDENGNMNMKWILKLQENNIGNVIYGFYGLIKDKDTKSKIAALMKMKSCLENLGVASKLYPDKSNYDAYYVFLATKDVVRSRDSKVRPVPVQNKTR